MLYSRYNGSSSLRLERIMGRQNDRINRGQPGAASDLLNFHFSAPPPQQPRSNNCNRNRRGGGNHARQSSQQQYRRSKEDRASSRRKASQQNFYLHSSPDHFFVISRAGKLDQQYTFKGPDSAVSWESVRLVKYLSSSQDSERCPICLEDGFVCPRITKCGHAFCFSCIIHHVQAYTADNLYKEGPRCPCCALPLHLQDLRPVQIYSVTAFTPNSTQHFIKLHRVKNCPAPFLPVPEHPRRSSPHAAPCQTDADAPFSKFNYVDPVVYQSHLTFNLQELQSQEPTRDPVEILCRGMAQERVQHELQMAMAEADQELALMERFANPAAGFYQPHPPPLTMRLRGESIGSLHSDESGPDKRQGKTKLQASMFMDQDETAFYQAEDGSLCFLSGFNMNCLRTEFSCTLPEEGITTGHKSMPLPDRLHGKVLEVERVHLTPELRSRLRFLSHLPVYMDICFVEINLGGLLSPATKKVYQKEFQKRKQTRQQRIQAEQRADARARKKEQDRIDELKARMQFIDPDDQFFHHSPPSEGFALTGDEFGPSIGTASTIAAPNPTSFSFSQITREGGAFPSLGGPDSSDFPSLGSSPTSSTNRSTWGPPPKTAPVVAPPPQGGKRKGKGKKVLLFSTGSHRGAIS